MLLFFSGCSKYQSVSGKVTYTDGSPVTVGQVACENGEFVARAYIDVQGNYRMGRIKDGDGISPGIYKVFLYDANIYEEPSGGGSSIVKPQVNAKYANPDSSGLTCEVKGKTVFNFKVEKP
jgi:hypothetical protein